MYFYIIKKDNCLSAIEADEKLFLAYEKRGFTYIDKVAAKDKKHAIKCLSKTSNIVKSSLSIMLSLAVLGITIFIIKM
ncbi:hypothetical protein KO527_24370 [Pseudoalteromonas sp. C2R02]|uniref:hypothetical protein n=1 Tax=Pseudoalteromonas sp. C2R02 TaxID=2841565 RepID=UPI001C081F79|nr:hypothetical protein [Pseudoalteromonas sp. C2R02]MBU2972474.1 hypothetical protein [Pseudoalteromonas sp. C2R02]